MNTTLSYNFSTMQNIISVYFREQVPQLPKQPFFLLEYNKNVNVDQQLQCKEKGAFVRSFPIFLPFPAI